MNEQPKSGKPEPLAGAVTIDRADYARILARLEALEADVASMRAALRQAEQLSDTPHEWNRRPGRLKGWFEVGPEFFDPLSDAELREFGIE